MVLIVMVRLRSLTREQTPLTGDEYVVGRSVRSWLTGAM
jgi:hypothetical protein